jgi:hypothetical protein
MNGSRVVSDVAGSPGAQHRTARLSPTTTITSVSQSVDSQSGRQDDGTARAQATRTQVHSIAATDPLGGHPVPLRGCATGLAGRIPARIRRQFQEGRKEHG